MSNLILIGQCQLLCWLSWNPGILFLHWCGFWYQSLSATPKSQLLPASILACYVVMALRSRPSAACRRLGMMDDLLWIKFVVRLMSEHVLKLRREAGCESICLSDSVEHLRSFIASKQTLNTPVRSSATKLNNNQYASYTHPNSKAINDGKTQSTNSSKNKSKNTPHHNNTYHSSSPYRTCSAGASSQTQDQYEWQSLRSYLEAQRNFDQTSRTKGCWNSTNERYWWTRCSTILLRGCDL